MAYSDVILSEPSLLHYYRCEEGYGATSLADAAGSLPLVPSGSFAAGILSGAENGCVRAVGGYAGATPASTRDAPYSVEAWFRMPASGTPGVLFGTRTGGSYFDIAVAPTHVNSNIGTGSSWLSNSAGASLSIAREVWHHLIYSITSTSWTAFLNGAQIGTGSLSGTARLWAAATTARIGHSGSASEGSTCWLDEVAVYSSALTLTQAAAHYAARSGPPESPPRAFTAKPKSLRFRPASAWWGKHLAIGWVFADGIRDLITGAQSTPGAGSSIAIGATGPVFRSDGTTTSGFDPNANPFAESDTILWAARVRLDSLSSTAIRMIVQRGSQDTGSGWNMKFYVDTSGIPTLAVISTSGGAVQRTGTAHQWLEPGRIYSLLGAWVPGSGIRVFVDGVESGAWVGTATGLRPSTGLLIAQSHITVDRWAGDIDYVYGFKGSGIDLVSMARDLHANPWAILRPQSSRTALFAADAPSLINIPAAIHHYKQMRA